MTPDEIRALDNFRAWKESPLRFVREVFGVEPDKWQASVLEAFPHRQRQAMLASKGVGKTAVLAWLAWNFLLTRPFSKVAATSITSDNLRDGLWTEMAVWQGKSELLKAAFEWNKERIVCRSEPGTWWMAARSWSRSADQSQQANTLAGLHADYMMFLLDEVGGTPDAVMAAAEAGLASGKECHIVMAGNPTHLEGPLYRAATSEAPLWHVTSVNGDPDNPERSPRVSLAWAKEQIQKYGRDNPWVLVNVFGKFPPSSINALIGPDEVRSAMGRHYGIEHYGHAAKVIGADVARFGDDASVICKRQGLVTQPFIVLRNVDGNQGAGRLAREWAEWEADAAMIDATGGFGSSWIDALRTMGRTPMSVQFAGEPIDARFANKRSEIIWLACEHVKSGGALPDCPELLADLTSHSYAFKGDKIIVEPKDQVKLTLGRSPDWSDSFACTFAYPVVPRTPFQMFPGMRDRPAPEYDPYANMNR